MLCGAMPTGPELRVRTCRPRPALQQAALQRLQKPKKMTYTALPSVRDSQMDGQSSVQSSPRVEPLFPFLDLKAQFDDIRDEVMEAVSRVLEDQRFILGQEVESLENEIAALIGARVAVACASGSDALLLSLQALGIGPDDEVITTPLTFVATASSVARAGARPVFIDIRPDTFNLDPGLIEAAIGSR